MNLKPYSVEKLKKLEPSFKVAIEKLLKEAHAKGLNVQVASGFRSFEEQNALFEQGRSKPGPIATNAKGGRSAHNYGRAVDLFFLVNEKADWGIGKFIMLAQLAKGLELPLMWAGKWKSFKEFCHFESNLP
jgi:peptidoglycan L-alanyl-D-glutamate endopeptidase CwlK